MLTAYGQLGLFNLESEEQQVIHGVLTGGHIKLVNCYSTNQRTTIGKFESTDETTWHCQFAFRRAYALRLENTPVEKRIARRRPSPRCSGKPRLGGLCPGGPSRGLQRIRQVQALAGLA